MVRISVCSFSLLSAAYADATNVHAAASAIERRICLRVVFMIESLLFRLSAHLTKLISLSCRADTTACIAKLFATSDKTDYLDESHWNRAQCSSPEPS